jgi:4a-hydroxytetrahydrobiopterin dehydratase
MNDDKGCPIDLANRKCVPCQGGVEPLKGDELKSYMEQLVNGWDVVEEHHLEREYKFKNFRKALAFTNKVGELAESEGHHPDIYLGWGRVKLTVWTHKIDGLHENDFIFATKVEKIEH